MSSDRFPNLGSVVGEDSFARIDIALRRGKHFHRDLGADYELLLDGQEHLEKFYQGYGCELVHRSEGYFFLLPVTEALGRRQMSVAEMIVGQGLALCYLDPAALEGGGVIPREEVLAQLAAVMGTDVLMHTFSPKKKRLDERVAQKLVRQKIAEGLKKLGALGFVDVLEGDRLKLRPSLMRFAEPVRGMAEPAEAMKSLMVRGEAALEQQEPEASSDDGSILEEPEVALSEEPEVEPLEEPEVALSEEPEPRDDDESELEEPS